MSTGKGRLKKPYPSDEQNDGLVTTDEGKAEVLYNFFAAAFTGNLSPHPRELMDHRMETRV